MKNTRAIIFGCTVLGAFSLAAHGAPPQATVVAQAEPSCQKEVKDYLGALQFVRQTSGTEIGTRVEQAFANEKEVTQLVAQQGHCAAARMLRERRAPR